MAGKDYLEFVLEQLSELQEITYRAMMENLLSIIVENRWRYI